MARSFQVNFQFSGLTGGTGQLMAYNRQLRQSVMLQRQLAAGAAPGGGGGQMVAAGGGAGGALMRAPTGNPFLRNILAQQNLQRLQQGGASPIAIAGAQYQAATAARAAQRAQQMIQGGPGPLQRLAQVLLTSRFGAGGLMPLVGRSLAALGITGAAAGPVALALAGIGLAGTALKALAEIAIEAGKSLQGFRMAGALSGGTNEEISKLTSFGVAPGDIAGRAAALRQRISSGQDPFAMAAGFRLLGGQRAPRPFGGTNEATDYLRIIEGLRGVKNAEEQLRLVRILGMEADLGLIRTSERVFEEMKRDAALRDKIFDPKAQQAAADLAGEQTRLTNGMENLKVAFGKALVPEMTRAAEGWANILNGLASVGNQHPEQMRNMFNSWLAGSPIGWLVAGGMKIGGAFAGKGDDPHTSAVKANTDALNKATAALTQPGTFGGGPRAQGALPDYLKGWAFDRAVVGKTLGLGAFNP